MRLLQIVCLIWSLEYLYEVKCALFNTNNYNIPCANSYKRTPHYNGGDIWFSDYTETTTELRDAILRNYTKCLPNILTSTLETESIFYDKQEQIFSADIADCIQIDDMLVPLRKEICDKTGMPFYLTNGPHSNWILLYNRYLGRIDRHVDNELLPADGLTIVITLHYDAEQCYNHEGSISTKSDKITFVPHLTAPHHTPVNTNGTRIVYQIRGSSRLIDTPIHFVLRKFKNLVYLGFPSLIVPVRLISFFKRNFGIIIDVKTIPFIKFQLSAEEQMVVGNAVSLIGNLIGHYTKYLLYCIGFLFPGAYKTQYRFWIRTMQFWLVISLFTQLSAYYNNVFFNAWNGPMFVIGQLLFIAGFLRIGGDSTFLGHWLIPNYSSEYTTKFPYNITNHPQYFGSMITYISLLLGAIDYITITYIIGHIVSLHLWVACEIYATKWRIKND